MKDRRLFIRVILKSLMFCGFLVLMAVFFNSLFTNQTDNKQSDNSKKLVTATIDISGMRKGETRRVRWGVKEVAVLYRQFSKKVKASDQTDHSASHLASSLLPETRSIKTQYFVYINHGDSGNCPLYYAKGEFNDTCSKNIFDENGMPVIAGRVNYQLKVPPHYFTDNVIHIGAWK